jgi:FdhD protein
VNRSSFEIAVERVSGGFSSAARDCLAAEEPLEIQLDYGPLGQRAVKSVSVTMRTPGDDLELAAGFLFTEGVIKEASDIQDFVYEPQSRPRPLREDSEEKSVLPYLPARNTLRVHLDPGVTVNLATLERNFYTTSSCGVCGKASLLALQSVCPPRAKNRILVRKETIYRLPALLRKTQEVFDQTGGLHAAGLFDAEGTLLSVREDVGRHNAVDKLMGAAFLADQIPLRDKLLLLSGRASFELLQKAVMGSISMVVSIGAPSSLAVQVARHFDVVLIGFLRDDHFNVYHGVDHLRGLNQVSPGEAA